MDAGSNAPVRSITLSAAVDSGTSPIKNKPTNKPTRRPDCGRQPFKPDKGDLDADSPFVLVAVQKLDEDSRQSCYPL